MPSTLTFRSDLDYNKVGFFLLLARACPPTCRRLTMIDFHPLRTNMASQITDLLRSRYPELKWGCLIQPGSTRGPMVTILGGRATPDGSSLVEYTLTWEGIQSEHGGAWHVAILHAGQWCIDEYGRRYPPSKGHTGKEPMLGGDRRIERKLRIENGT